MSGLQPQRQLVVTHGWLKEAVACASSRLTRAMSHEQSPRLSAAGQAKANFHAVV
ncbi:TPA: hypothetical protein KYC80_002358 [Escherichia coli]|nr:hypothetical protein [Escherichia coli]